MNDDERDARMETLTDAIADTNRAVAALTGNVDALTVNVDALTVNVDALTGDLGQLRSHGESVDRRLESLIDVSARTAHQVNTLNDLVRLHLRIDHNYPDPDPGSAS